MTYKVNFPTSATSVVAIPSCSGPRDAYKIPSYETMLISIPYNNAIVKIIVALFNAVYEYILPSWLSQLRVLCTVT